MTFSFSAIFSALASLRKQHACECAPARLDAASIVIPPSPKGIRPLFFQIAPLPSFPHAGIIRPPWPRHFPSPSRSGGKCDGRMREVTRLRDSSARWNVEGRCAGVVRAGDETYRDGRCTFFFLSFFFFFSLTNLSLPVYRADFVMLNGCSLRAYDGNARYAFVVDLPRARLSAE